MVNGHIDRQKIETVVRKVLQELQNQAVPAPAACEPCTDNGIFPTVDDAVRAARLAFEQWSETSLSRKKLLIEAIREAGRSNARELAEMAVAETGLGRVACKTNKNLLVANKTPGLEYIKPTAISGDFGLTLLELAPHGVVGAITPVTNPAATIINNAISILSAGNTIVFNVHPSARAVCTHCIQLLNKVIVSHGGPPNLLTGVAQPTIESAQQLIACKDIDLLLVTGGPAVVRVAMQSDKRAICAGPGNPPVVVDETALIEKAGRDIIAGASFDNNLPCTCEKEVFVVEQVADRLKAAMSANNGFEVPADAIPRLEKVIFLEMGSPGRPGKINPKWIGQNAGHILREAGINVDWDVRVAFLEVPASHPLVWTEQMMPALPIVRVRDVDEAIALAYRAEHGFKHTAIMHSQNVAALSKMGKVMNTAIFVKNAPSFAGLGYEGEGHTSFSIGTRTGEGLTTCLTFTRERRCSLADSFRII